MGFCCVAVGFCPLENLFSAESTIDKDVIKLFEQK
jgi:hypothetical protein